MSEAGEVSQVIDWVAVYAAIVATLALGWRAYEWLRDRASIRLEVNFMWYLNTPGFDPDKRWISVIAMNRGRRATTMSSAGFRTNRKTDLVYVPARMTGELPKRLDEGERCFVNFNEQQLKEQLSKLGPSGHVEFAWFRDQTNRLYKTKLTATLKKAIQDG